MKRALIFLLTLMLLPLPCFADDIPEDAEAVAIGYMNPVIEFGCTICDPDWVYQSEDDLSQVYFFDPENTANMISISSQPRPSDEPTQVAEGLWNWYADYLADVGYSLKDVVLQDITVGKSLFPGFRYEATISGAGVNDPLIYLFWFTSDRVFTCSVSFAPADETHVREVLQGILDSFLSFTDDLDVETEESAASQPAPDYWAQMACVDRNGAVSLLDYGEEIPADLMPYSLIYIDAVLCRSVTVWNPDWIFEPTNGQGTALFYDPLKEENRISVTAYPYPDGMTREDRVTIAESIFSTYCDEIGVTGADAAEITEFETGMGVFYGAMDPAVAGFVYDAVQFSYTEFRGGADVPCQALCLFGDDLWHFIVAENADGLYAEYDAEDVDFILFSLHSSIYNPLS